MPCTFSHPVAVLPFRRLCPKWLNFPSLAIGSMSPDFGYFFHAFGMAGYAHGLAGVLVVCVPAGLAAVVAFYLLRVPFCSLLPHSHREGLLTMIGNSKAPKFREVPKVVLSLVIGALTHIIWDSFTHDTGWAARNIRFLSAPIFRIGETTLPACYFLQQLSSLGGDLLLALFYWKWWKTHCRADRMLHERKLERHLYRIWGLIALLAGSSGLLSAIKTAQRFEGYLALRVMMFRTVVDSIAVAIPLLLAAALLLHYSHRGERP